MRNFFELHPAVRIVVWIFCASLAFSANAAVLAVLSLCALLFPQEFLRLLRRCRWILAALFVVYAYSTPGALLFASWASPTREGLMFAAMQSWRIAATLAALSVLVCSTSRERILSGIYELLRPLALLGVAPEKIALRLALTLHYAETAGNWRSGMQPLFSSEHYPAYKLRLDLYRLRLRDAVALSLVAATGAFLL